MEQIKYKEESEPWQLGGDTLIVGC